MKPDGSLISSCSQASDGVQTLASGPARVPESQEIVPGTLRDPLSYGNLPSLQSA